jgi:hypothetical protein
VTPVSTMHAADTTIGALNVYDSSLATSRRTSRRAASSKVRLLEGFSGEEGGVDMFGTTEFDGQSKYGEIPIRPTTRSRRWCPGNVPFHIQLVDKFGMSLANESVWISGRAGEQRFCGRLPREPDQGRPRLAPASRQRPHGSVNLVEPRAQRVSPTAYACRRRQR